MTDFKYFRAWLIGRGKAAYEAAVADPDSLIGFAPGPVECEEMMYVADEAFESSTGQAEMQRHVTPYPELGDEWDFDDAELMRARYPKLTAKFGT